MVYSITSNLKGGEIMKLVVIKKGTKKWSSTGKPEDAAGCCMMVEGSYWPCYEVAIDN